MRGVLIAGGHRRARLFLFAVLVALWALSGPLGAAVCALDGCDDDGCGPATCHHPAAAAGTTGDSIDAAGCTCSARSRATTEAVIPAADHGVPRFAGSWLAAALPSVAPLSAPRPRLPHPEVRPLKPLSVITAVTGSRAPPSA